MPRPPLLSELRFGAFFVYYPYGESPASQRAKTLSTFLKQDRMLSFSHPPVPTSEFLARSLSLNLAGSVLEAFLRSEAILVPVPRSAPARGEDWLWPPRNIAQALVRHGIAGRVETCLRRTEAVQKSAFVAAKDRPLAREHFETMAVEPVLEEPESILLVDDIVTRGSTLLGAASRLHNAFPQAKIRAFAAMRTLGEEVRRNPDPTLGTIRLNPSGKTYRDDESR